MHSEGRERASGWPPQLQRLASSWLPLLVVALLSAYVLGLAVRSDSSYSPAVDGWLALFAMGTAVVLCWTAAARSRFRQPEVTLGSAAVTAQFLGDAAYIAALDGENALVDASVADVFYLAFYPFMLSAVIVVVVRQLRNLLWPFILDTLVGTCGAAAVMALILSPVLNEAFATSPSLATVVAIAYPLLDVAIFAAIAGVLASPGLEIGRRWPTLIWGLIIYTAADVVYASELSDYVVGSVLDAAWAIGTVCLALWVDSESRPDRPRYRVMKGVPALAAPVLSTVAALGVLILASEIEVALLAVGLAALTLALAVVPLIFRHRMLRAQATTDELTGLPNRRAFVGDFPARLGTERGGALILLDLNRFKQVNDTLGHDAGDTLLRQVGLRLSQEVRALDFVARLGGDEFALFLDGVDDRQAVEIAERIGLALRAPIHVDGSSLEVSASLGIALTPLHGRDLSGLMRKADIAMFKAKSNRLGHHVYQDGDDHDGAQRVQTLQELHHALAHGEFELHYQPKLHLNSREIRGVEALVRWNHPTRGLLYPDAFLSLVEDGGLMPMLTDEVLRRSLDQAVRWKDEGRALTISVNVSVSSLTEDLPERIRLMLAERELPPSSLMLEITEDVLVDHWREAPEVLLALRDAGIQLSIDDFGTGYSSLAYLRDLPVDELKLDRSFVAPMMRDKRSAGLVASIIGLAHSLGLQVVAEGVEHRAALEALDADDCDYAQGFHVFPAVPSPELESVLGEYPAGQLNSSRSNLD